MNNTKSIHLKLMNKSSINLDIVYHYFSKEYIQSLWNKIDIDTSLKSRYRISELMREKLWYNSYIPLSKNNWIPIRDKPPYRSISHKEELIFVWVSKQKIWIDLEKFRERTIEVLNIFTRKEYEILWGKNYHNFYILWTAKESVIKYNLWNLNNMENIKLIKIIDANIIISWISFIRKLFLYFEWEIFEVLFGKEENIYYSICIDKKNSFKIYPFSFNLWY